MKKLSALLFASCFWLMSSAQQNGKDLSNYYEFMMRGLSELLEDITLAEPSPALQAKTIEIEQNKVLEYTEKGDPQGVPVILLHGFTDSRHSFDKLLPLMPDMYHVFAISQRGHGNSGKTFSSYTVTDFARDVAAFITKQHLKPAVVIGHCMGGLVAQQVAIDYPQLVKAMVIIDSDASFGDNPGVPEFMQEVMKLQAPVDRSFMEAFQKATISRPASPAYFDTLVEESRKVPAAVLQAVAKDMVRTDLSAWLPRIEQPVLLLWGEQDSFCLRKDQEAMKRAMRRAQLAVYPGTGHALHWEEPQKCAQDINRFLATLHSVQ